MLRRQFRRDDLITGPDGYLGIYLKDLGNGESEVFLGNGLRTGEKTLALTGMPRSIGSPLGADPYSNFAEILKTAPKEHLLTAWGPIEANHDAADTLGSLGPQQDEGGVPGQG